jgi:hypothetical protein
MNCSILEKNKTRFIPVTRWNEYHDWPSQAALRYYIFNAKINNFDSVTKRVGRRVLLDESAFFAWIENSGQKQDAQKAGGAK